eukprot:CAMPEP_0183434862 /NCGR_PEP_ID=MMETSP0370-20130417/65161_1 /TAXON_ID=268820 /ORGANISM="Peridinium aciculiferum, Strain PAER-2" /LENGTH=243 /DNA_ID=CAMNT_0025621693 /DNA_START=47 /DNA_END=778 /DNA_ORIENTATION=-
MACMTCQVCFEAMTKRLALPELKTGNGDILRSADCNHPICTACLAGHIAARVEQQLVCIRCPAVDCTNRLFEQDLKRLVTSSELSQEVCDQFAEICSRDYGARAKEFADCMTRTLEDADIQNVRRLWETTRLCPRCSVAIEKSHGCNSFYCFCGHHFNYDAAPRAVGNGIRRFGHVLTLAKDLRMPVREAEKFGEWKVFFKAGRIAGALGISLEEACELHKKAESGDEDARAEIRRARALTKQ